MIQKVYAELDTMTKTERQAAEYFLAHPDEFALLTLDKLALKVGVSTASIIRFCRRLGFFGYKDFQETLRDGMSNRMPLPIKLAHSRSTQADQLLDRVALDGIQAIHQTLNELSAQALSAAVELLEDSRRVFTFGLRESYAMAHYLYTRLITIRDNVHILDTGFHTMLEPLLDLNADDTIVVFLFRRYTEQSLRMLPLLKATGASVIVITSAPCDEGLAAQADVLLPCHVENNGIKNTYLAPMCLADYFCNALGQTEAVGNRIEQIEALLRDTSALGQ